MTGLITSVESIDQHHSWSLIWNPLRDEVYAERTTQKQLHGDVTRDEEIKKTFIKLEGSRTKIPGQVIRSW